MEETAMKGMKTLEEQCENLDFHVSLLGNNYCNLARTKRVECKYLGKIKDHNDMYPCLNLNYNSNESPSKLRN